MKKIKYKGKKIKIHHAESVNEAIDDLQTFLECDLYSKFRPENRIPLTENGKKKTVSFYREDFFVNEREFLKYLDIHFKLLKKEIKRLAGNKKIKFWGRTYGFDKTPIKKVKENARKLQKKSKKVIKEAKGLFK